MNEDKLKVDFSGLKNAGPVKKRFGLDEFLPAVGPLFYFGVLALGLILIVIGMLLDFWSFLWSLFSSN